EQACPGLFQPEDQELDEAIGQPSAWHARQYGMRRPVDARFHTREPIGHAPPLPEQPALVMPSGGQNCFEPVSYRTRQEFALTKRRHPTSLRTSSEDIAVSRKAPDTPQTRSAAYRLAFADDEFM